MAGTGRAIRSYVGLAAEPLKWSEVEAIFDAIFGSDVRDLRNWPETFHNLDASWHDDSGVEHPAKPLSEVENAYASHRTAKITFSGWREHGEYCEFHYWLGSEQVRGQAMVQGAPDKVDDMIAPVSAAFPLQRRVIFISWSGELGKRVAEALTSVLKPRLPAGGEVFFSPEIRPGADPFKEMLDRNLLVADVHVVVVTSDSAKSLWATWETAASWGRRKPVIPIFVGIQASEVEDPLGQLAQGVPIDDEQRLMRGLEEALIAVGGETDAPLTSEEREALTQARNQS